MLCLRVITFLCKLVFILTARTRTLQEFNQRHVCTHVNMTEYGRFVTFKYMKKCQKYIIQT